MGETPEVYSKYASELHAHWQNFTNLLRQLRNDFPIPNFSTSFKNFWLFIIINTWINYNLILDTFMNVICVNRKACTSASWHVNTTPTSFVVGLSNNNNSIYQEKLCVTLNIPTRLTTERMWQVNRTVNITFRTIHLACTHCTYTQM